MDDLARAIASRRNVLAAAIAVLPAVASAKGTRVGTEQIGCPPKCKCTRKKGCCRLYYVEAGGFCHRDSKDCSEAAESYCKNRGFCGGC